MAWRFRKSRERLRREAADWLARLEGPGGDAAREGFRRWYEADPAHAETYDRIASLWRQAGRLSRATAGRQQARPVKPDRPRTGARHALAAVLAGLFVAGAALLATGTLHFGGSEPRTLMFATAVGEVRAVSLEDGSRVLLDTNSSVSVRIGRNEREVVLNRGRARFAVAQEPRPFIVRMHAGLQVEGGRVFDVGLLGGTVRIVPIEGDLAVLSGSSGAAPQRIVAGQRLTIAGTSGRRGTEPARNADTAWPSRMVEFDATPLDEAIAEANRYSLTKLRLADPSLGRLRVTGAYRAGDIAGLARSLEAAFGLRLEREGRNYILHRRR